MEMIKNYLETMFKNLPNTKDILRAKYELGQMMEDKYSELREEGKTDNEAIGIVISEFGNLDELADDLGIGRFVQTEENNKVSYLQLEQAKDYLHDKEKHGLRIGIGVLLCVCSPSGVILADNTVSLLSLFLMIGIAVGIFVYSGVVMGKWNAIEKNHYSIDFSLAEYVHREKENNHKKNALLHTIGVVLYVTCFVPLVIMDEVNAGEGWENIGVVLLLAMVGLGVVCTVTASAKNSAYDMLLKLNGAGTRVGKTDEPWEEEVHYENKTLAAVMSVYWPTAVCIYLCWSFLTFDWHITWIVFVIASVIESYIKNINKG